MNNIKKWVKKNYFWILVMIGIVIILMPFFINFREQNISAEIGDWASFGDYIGGTLGALAFFALCYTILQQIKSLQIQEKTTILQQESIEKQQKALDEQVFSNLYGTIVNSINQQQKDINNLLKDIEKELNINEMKIQDFFRNRCQMHIINEYIENFFHKYLADNKLEYYAAELVNIESAEKKRVLNNSNIYTIESEILNLSLKIKRILELINYQEGVNKKFKDEYFNMLVDFINSRCINLLYSVGLYEHLFYGDKQWDIKKIFDTKNNLFKYAYIFAFNRLLMRKLRETSFTYVDILDELIAKENNQVNKFKLMKLKVDFVKYIDDRFLFLKNNEKIRHY